MSDAAQGRCVRIGTVIDLASEEGRRLMEARGAIESGQIANMRTYRLADDARVHVRIVGEGQTLCGRSLRHNAQWAWQFIHRGRAAYSMPAHVDCLLCLRHPIVAATLCVNG